jgi:hypothetical protein
MNDPTAEDEDFEIYGQDSEEDILTDFLTGMPAYEDSESHKYLPIDINFVLQGLPKLSVTYPHQEKVQQITVEIGLNADLKAAVRVEHPKEIQSDDDIAARKSAIQSARALDVCEELGTLVEYLKS